MVATFKGTDLDYSKSWFMLNPTHNTSMATAKIILQNGAGFYDHSKANKGYVSLRYGVGAMYFGGADAPAVMFEMKSRKLFSLKNKAKTTLIDKGGMIDHYVRRTGLRTVMGQSLFNVLIAIGNTILDAYGIQRHDFAPLDTGDIENFYETLDYYFDASPEIRVLAPTAPKALKLSMVSRCYYLKNHKAAFDTEVRPHLGHIQAVEVDPGIADDALYSMTKAKFATLMEQKTAGGMTTAQASYAIRAELARKRVFLHRVDPDQAVAATDDDSDNGYLERYNGKNLDYNILSPEAHYALTLSFFEKHFAFVNSTLDKDNHILNVRDEYGDDNFIDDAPRPPIAAKSNIYIFKRYVSYDASRDRGEDFAHDRPLLIELGGQNPNHYNAAAEDPLAPDRHVCFEAHNYNRHGISLLNIPSAWDLAGDRSNNEIYLATLERLFARGGPIITAAGTRRYRPIVIMGFCASSIAVPRFVCKGDYASLVDKIILAAPNRHTIKYAFPRGGGGLPQKFRHAQTCFLIAWDSDGRPVDDRFHTNTGFETMHQRLREASYSDVSVDGGAKTHGLDYYNYGGAVVNDIAKFVMGEPIKRMQSHRQDKLLDRVEQRRADDTTAVIWATGGDIRLAVAPRRRGRGAPRIVRSASSGSPGGRMTAEEKFYARMKAARDKRMGL